jgi:RimJ/RimL family protein N-acetyltransferase
LQARSQGFDVDPLSLADLDAQISTQRLVLEPIRSEHAEALYSVLSDASLYQYTQDVPPESPAALGLRYKRLESRRSPDGEQAWLNWALVENATGTPIGYVQATVIANHADVAWVVGTPWQRRGFATEAAQSLVEWLRCAGVGVVRAKINGRHTASQRVATRLGLARTGEMIDGEEVWMSKLEECR